MTSQSIFTDAFQIKNAERLYNTVALDESEHYYVFGAKSTPWDNDNNPDSVNTAILSISYETNDQILFGKKISANNVSMMVPNIPWVTGTVYDTADSSIDLTSKNFYAVTNDSGSYHVFKCLYNNGGVPSTQQPLYSDISSNPSTETYYTIQDGYHWKYMYSIPTATYNQFSTSAYIPCIPNANVAANAINGSIDQISISNPGSYYDNWTTGQFTIIGFNGNNSIMGISPTANSSSGFYANSDIYITSGTGAGQLLSIKDSYSISESGTFVIPVVNTSTNTVSNVSITTTGFNLIVLNTPFTVTPAISSEYYIAPRVTVTGDGSNCSARSIISPAANSISQVEIVSSGTNYSYANVSIIGARTSNGISNTANCTAIISPPGGHGSNTALELGAKYVGISINMGNNEPYALPSTGEYRRIGVIGNPLLSNVSVLVSNVVSSCSSLSNTFSVGCKVTGVSSNSTGIVNISTPSEIWMTMVNGIFQTGETLTQSPISVSSTNVSISAIASTVNENLTFDNRTRLNIGAITGTGNSSFIINEQVSQINTGAFGYVYSLETSNTMLTLTEVKGSFSNSHIITGLTSGASANVTSVVIPDLVKYTGDVVHIENFQPITRSPSQSETLKIVLGYN